MKLTKYESFEDLKNSELNKPGSEKADEETVQKRHEAAHEFIEELRKNVKQK